jgi:Tol biopolymer transport system component
VNGEPRGEPRAVTNDIKSIMGFDWTADGRALILASDRGGVHALWRVDASGGEPERLSVGSDFCLWPSVSRRSGRLAYVKATVDYNIWRVAAPGAAAAPPGAPEKVTQSPLLEISPSLSPDGSRVAYASSSSGEFSIWTCRMDGSQPVRLSQGLWPQWSPDGRQVAFLKTPDMDRGHSPRIFGVDADGGSPRRLTEGDFPETYPVWSRDGRWFYFSSARGEDYGVWRMPAAGGQPVLVLPKVLRMTESADGIRFFYSERGRIWSVAAAGGDPVPVLTTDSPIWTLSASGIYVLDAYAEGGPALEFFPFAGKGRPETMRLGGVPEDYYFTFERLDVSTDGRWLVYSYRDRHEADIMLVENFR